jgi:hypothetical protein
MKSLFSSGQDGRAFWVTFFITTILFCVGSLNAYAQGCPALYSPNRGWAQNTIVQYAFDPGFTDEQKRQIRATAAEWNRANSVNNSKVSFVEDTSGTNAKLRFQIASPGVLPPGNPADYQANYDAATFTINSAVIRYDPNNTFPGTSTLVSDPTQPGYSTVITKLILHEMGHTMGLDHPPSPVPGGSVMNFASGINDQGNNIPTTVTACDQSTLNSETLYPPITLAAPTLQIDASSVANPFNESAGQAQVVVTRSGDHTTQVSVDYATSDAAGLTPCNVVNGNASSRCDYATTIGTLRFDSGEISKTIYIPLVDDSYHEGNETFSITLSNPQGASLVSPTTATITIADDDATTGANPIDNTAFFVNQHYIDFLDRVPDAAYTTWQNILNNCPASGKDANGNFCDRIEVSSDFFRSPEFQDRGYFIYRFYKLLPSVTDPNNPQFGHIPLYSEFMPDFARVSGPLTADQLEANKVAFIADFMNRAEFRNRYGSITDNAAFVDAILQTLGLPNHPNRTTWIAELNAGKTRAQVLREIIEDQQVYQKFYNEAFVIMQYFGYLRRNADASYVSWISTMNASGDYRTMINGFLNSAEYRQRFGP